MIVVIYYSKHKHSQYMIQIKISLKEHFLFSISNRELVWFVLFLCSVIFLVFVLFQVKINKILNLKKRERAHREKVSVICVYYQNQIKYNTIKVLLAYLFKNKEFNNFLNFDKLFLLLQLKQLIQQLQKTIRQTRINLFIERKALF